MRVCVCVCVQCVCVCECEVVPLSPSSMGGYSNYYIGCEVNNQIEKVFDGAWKGGGGGEDERIQRRMGEEW